MLPCLWRQATPRKTGRKEWTSVNGVSRKPGQNFEPGTNYLGGMAASAPVLKYVQEHKWQARNNPGPQACTTKAVCTGMVPMQGRKCEAKDIIRIDWEWMTWRSRTESRWRWPKSICGSEWKGKSALTTETIWSPAGSFMLNPNKAKRAMIALGPVWEKAYTTAFPVQWNILIPIQPRRWVTRNDTDFQSTSPDHVQETADYSSWKTDYKLIYYKVFEWCKSGKLKAA